MKTKFEGYLNEKGYSQRTIVTYQQAVRYYKQWLETEKLEAEQVSYTDALAYIQKRKTHQSQRSLQNQLIGLKHYYQYQEMPNPFERIQLKGVKKHTLYHLLEPHQLHSLYASFTADNPIGIRNKAILGLLIYQGLMIREIAALKIKDIALRAGTVYVAGSRKSNERTLELERNQVMDLYEYVMQIRKGQGEENLFTSKNLSDVVHKLIKKLATPVSLRQLRASVIVKWLKSTNLREAQYRAGHRYVSSTEKYQQNEIEGLREEVQQFHPLG